MVKVIVPISGGKDSQTCLKLACQSFPKKDILALFCDTQFEHPITYTHIKKIIELYDVNFVSISGGSVIEKVIKYNRFPMGGARFCTDELKMRETKLFCKQLALQQKEGFDLWYGMRLGESINRKKKYTGYLDTEKYKMHEIFPGKYPKYLEKLGVFMRLPILNWTDTDVFDFLGDEINPLYSMGFDRVGCFPCLAAGDTTKEKAFNFDDFGRQQHQKVIWLEELTEKSVWSNEEKHGCSLCSI